MCQASPIATATKLKLLLFLRPEKHNDKYSELCYVPILAES